MDMTKTEILLIHEIARRANAMTIASGLPEYKVIDAALDVLAVHERTPLRLEELLAAAPFHFNHDVLGIRANLDRTTKRLANHWTPRHAAVSRKEPA